MKRVVITRDGAVITIEGDKAEEVAKEFLSPPPHVGPQPPVYIPYPVYPPAPHQTLVRCQWCGAYDCHQLHVICSNNAGSLASLANGSLASAQLSQ